MNVASSWFVAFMKEMRQDFLDLSMRVAALEAYWSSVQYRHAANRNHPTRNNTKKLLLCKIQIVITDDIKKIFL